MDRRFLSIVVSTNTRAVTLWTSFAVEVVRRLRLRAALGGSITDPGSSGVTTGLVFLGKHLSCRDAGSEDA
jgi:hypothetical protein